MGGEGLGMNRNLLFKLALDVFLKLFASVNLSPVFIWGLYWWFHCPLASKKNENIYRVLHVYQRCQYLGTLRYFWVSTVSITLVTSAPYPCPTHSRKSVSANTLCFYKGSGLKSDLVDLMWALKSTHSWERKCKKLWFFQLSSSFSCMHLFKAEKANTFVLVLQ